jgi:phage tail-like protein
MSGYYPPANFQFAVTLLPLGLTGADAAFNEVSGLETERESVAVKEGGENRFVHQVPGRVKQGKLTMKRGLLVSHSPMFVWCQASLEGDLGEAVQPKDIMVSLLDQTSAPLMVWHMSNAWPVKWSIGAFNAQENKVAMETLEFAYAYMQRFIAKDLGFTGTFNV